MLLHLHEFHVKGDSRPPSQSPMRSEKLSANSLCLQSDAGRSPLPLCCFSILASQSSHRARNSSSVSTGMPSSRAFCSLLPTASPATT